MESLTVKINKPADCNIIIGQAHFIKTVEDIYEALVTSCPGIKFGVAFCEASGECLVRSEANDDELKKIAIDNALAIASGHSFIIVFKNAFPINVLNSIKNVQEVCNIFCASANPIEVILAESSLGRGIIGVIDGYRPKGVETQINIQQRRELLRKIGYKC